MHIDYIGCIRICGVLCWNCKNLQDTMHDDAYSASYAASCSTAQHNIKGFSSFQYSTVVWKHLKIRTENTLNFIFMLLCFPMNCFYVCSITKHYCRLLWTMRNQSATVRYWCWLGSSPSGIIFKLYLSVSFMYGYERYVCLISYALIAFLLLDCKLVSERSAILQPITYL